jgi:hypothetical protein
MPKGHSWRKKPPPSVSSGGNFYETSGYLGLRFQIDGQTFYGRAFLTVGTDTATLTGYAYENTPGTPINAGQTTEDSSTLRPSALNPPVFAASVSSPAQGVSIGMLPLGAKEVPLLRRKESPEAAPENV